MKRQEDIYALYDEIDELLESVGISNKKMENNNKVERQITDMPKVYIDNDKKAVIYKNVINEVKEEKNIDQKKEVETFNFDNKQEVSTSEIAPTEEIKIEKNNIIEEEKEVKEKKVSKIKKKKSKKWVIAFAVLDTFAIICLFLMYGPISYFRNLWVTSAMTTRSHQYLAYIFFNEEQISYIMSNNTVIEVEGETNQEEIQIDINNTEEIVEYSSPEEEQVLKRDPGNDLYKVIKVEGSGYKGHLLVVYDPSKIELVQSPSKTYGLTIEQFVEKNNAIAGINAGGFIYSASAGYSPLGALIQDGQIYSTGVSGWGGGIIGFTNDNVLVLTKASAEEAVQMGIRDAVSFGPFLIVNGVASEFKGNGGYGIAPRTAIGQRTDGIVLMLVIDGRRPGHSIGVDMSELANIMLKYGAYNASNLDGGGSSTIVVNGKTLSVAGGSGYSGDRYMSNAWIIKQ